MTRNEKRCTTYVETRGRKRRRIHGTDELAGGSDGRGGSRYGERSHPYGEFSFSPARFPFFYGWVIAVVGTLGIFASVPGQTMGVSVFTDHLLVVLSIERIGLTEAYMVGPILSSFLLPLAGKFYDRWGARTMVVLASLALGLTLIYPLSYKHLKLTTKAKV